jgi:rod shape determining protein RodA
MRSEIWRHFDFWLLGAVAILIIFGIAMINSAIAGNIELIENQAVERQILFAGAGFAVILIVAAIDYHLWASIGRVLYVLLIIFLTSIVVAGEAAFGAQRLLDIGFLVIQPSELAKITMIVLLADFFARNQRRIKEIPWIARSVFLTAGLVGLLVIWFSLLWAAGLELKHLAVFAALGLIAPIVAFPFLQPYQQERIITFLFPDPDASFGAIYNVNQALISIGSGGWLGEGYGQGSQVQLRFLKVRHSDFIFSVISNELGFIGALLAMALLFFVIYRCLRAARLAHDTMGALIAYGVAAWIGFQAMVNIGMNLNILPVTGLPLPFVSHGGSSLLSLMLGIGLVESVIARHKALEF